MTFSSIVRARIAAKPVNRPSAAAAIGYPVARMGALLVLLVTLRSVPAFGQADPNGPDPSKVRVKLGPVMLNPTVALRNVGIDQNVFNETINPKSDFTLTVTPRTDVFLRFMGTWFTGTVAEDLVWFQTYATQRQNNNTVGLAWKWPLTRLTVNASATHISTKDRPGFEIDERAQRAENKFQTGVVVKLLASTGLEVTTKRETVDYDPTAEYRGVNLHDELNEVVSGVAIGINQRLTPLTTATIDLNREHTSFTYNPLRDSDRTEVRLMFRFDPQALLKGSMMVGYTDFSPASSVMPKYTGFTLGAELTYTMYETTKFTVKAARDVQNSYDIEQPYYVQTGGTLEIAQQVAARFDVVARGGLQRMHYQDRSDVVVDFANRTDRVVSFGGGFGYHQGQNLRIGINIDQARRESVIGSRNYTRPSFGTSITYDF